MTNLEYKIGGLDIKRELLHYFGADSHDASHKFIVAAHDKVLTLYISRESSHPGVSEKFGLHKMEPRPRIPGGGSLYLDKKDYLVLDDFSGVYGSVPKEIVQKFAGLLVPRLRRRGLKITAFIVNPNEEALRAYWKEFGFEPST